MSNPNPDNQNQQQQQGGQQDQGGQNKPGQGGQQQGGQNKPGQGGQQQGGQNKPGQQGGQHADLNSKARHIAGPLPYVGRLNLNSLRGFRLPIDRAFRDLSEGRIGPLFFIESLFEKTDSIA